MICACFLNDVFDVLFRILLSSRSIYFVLFHSCFAGADVHRRSPTFAPTFTDVHRRSPRNPVFTDVQKHNVGQCLPFSPTFASPGGFQHRLQPPASSSATSTLGGGGARQLDFSGFQTVRSATIVRRPVPRYGQRTPCRLDGERGRERAREGASPPSGDGAKYPVPRYGRAQMVGSPTIWRRPKLSCAAPLGMGARTRGPHHVQTIRTWVRTRGPAARTTSPPSAPGYGHEGRSTPRPNPPYLGTDTRTRGQHHVQTLRTWVRTRGRTGMKLMLTSRRV